jgi:hypothetical protein
MGNAIGRPKDDSSKKKPGMKKLPLAVIGALLLTGSLLAHHSRGGVYDHQIQVLLKGRVVKVTFRKSWGVHPALQIPGYRRVLKGAASLRRMALDEYQWPGPRVIE